MMEKLKIKICGMRDRANIKAVEELRPDYIGFNFVPTSPRYVGKDFDPSVIHFLPRHTKAVGVFANQPVEEVTAIIAHYQLPVVQLHGDETPTYCQQIKSSTTNLEVIKCISVGKSFDVHGIASYHDAANYLLFDSAGTVRGGTGKTFDWNLLSNYRGHHPFFLAGGLAPEHAPALKRLRTSLRNLFAVDLNSCFETSPGIKSVPLLAQFIRELHS